MQEQGRRNTLDSQAFPGQIIDVKGIFAQRTENQPQGLGHPQCRHKATERKPTRYQTSAEP